MIDDLLLYEVARDYHIEHKLQREIAAKLGVSRVQVGNYLKMAEDRGIIRVQVVAPTLPKNDMDRLGEFFRREFGLDDIVVTPSSVRPERLARILAVNAREYIETTLPNDSINVGFGWGTTMYHVAHANGIASRPLWKIVPISGGNSLVSDKVFNINHIVHTFAESCGAQALPIYLSFWVAPDERDGVFRSEAFRRVGELWNDLDVLLLSVGYDIARSPLFRTGAINSEYMDELENAKVVCDVASHFFDIDGAAHSMNFEEGIINISMDQIRKVDRRIIVAGGFHKVESIIGVLRAGLVHVLIIDFTTAQTIMDYLTNN